MDHVVKQLVVECKADTVRSLDRSTANPDSNERSQEAAERRIKHLQGNANRQYL